jgi:muconolactone delta-isomerase
MWQVEQSLLSDAMSRAIARMPEYGSGLQSEGKVVARYHVVGAHGGAWIYDVDDHEEFERLLARAPVFNFSRYTVHPLVDMATRSADDDSDQRRFRPSPGQSVTAAGP